MVIVAKQPKSPLERGAALAAGCVSSLKLLFFYTFYYFFGNVLIDFRLKHTPALLCPPLKRGFFCCFATKTHLFKISNYWFD